MNDPWIEWNGSEKLPKSLKVDSLTLWLARVVELRCFEPEELSVVFMDDASLLELNKRYLDHDTLTDIITFDYCEDKRIIGELCISYDRIKENANRFDVSTESEFLRVLAHGVLHLCGLGDKSNEEVVLMREGESEAMALYQDMFHVEQEG